MSNIKQHDWEALKREYVLTNITTTELSKKHNVRLASLSKRCSEEGWVKLRKDHNAKMSEMLLEKVRENMAEEASKQLVQINIIVGELINQALYFLETNDAISPIDLEHLVTVVAKAEKVARSTSGVLSKLDQTRLDIDEQRLNLEIAKVNMIKPDDTIRIIVKGYEESWSQ